MHPSTPSEATRALGLDGHPELHRSRQEAGACANGKQQRWDRNLVHAKVIYHADSFTLYRQAAPSLSFHGDEVAPAEQVVALDQDELCVREEIPEQVVAMDVDMHDPLATFGLQEDCPNGIDVLEQYFHFGKALTNHMVDHYDCILSQTRGCYI